MEKILNQDGIINSIQISHLEDIPSGKFNPGINFLVKNITEENITAVVIPAGMTKEVTTILYPGWNVEILKSIKGVQPKQLQYGY